MYTPSADTKKHRKFFFDVVLLPLRFCFCHGKAPSEKVHEAFFGEYYAKFREYFHTRSSRTERENHEFSILVIIVR